MEPMEDGCPQKTGEGCFVIRLLLMVNHFDGRNMPSNTPKRPVHGDSAVCIGIVQVALAAGPKHYCVKKVASNNFKQFPSRYLYNIHLQS